MINTAFSFAQGLEILITILTFSAVLCFTRLFLGPDVPNRTAAFDTIAIHAVAILALYAIRIDAPAILDVAIITAVLGFLGTTLMARYLQRSAPRYHALRRTGTNRGTENERNPLPLDRSDPISP